MYFTNFFTRRHARRYPRLSSRRLRTAFQDVRTSTAGPRKPKGGFFRVQRETLTGLIGITTVTVQYLSGSTSRALSPASHTSFQTLSPPPTRTSPVVDCTSGPAISVYIALACAVAGIVLGTGTVYLRGKRGSTFTPRTPPPRPPSDPPLPPPLPPVTQDEEADEEADDDEDDGGGPPNDPDPPSTGSTTEDPAPPPPPTDTRDLISALLWAAALLKLFSMFVLPHLRAHPQVAEFQRLLDELLELLNGEALALDLPAQAGVDTVVLGAEEDVHELASPVLEPICHQEPLKSPQPLVPAPTEAPAIPPAADIATEAPPSSALPPISAPPSTITSTPPPTETPKDWGTTLRALLGFGVLGHLFIKVIDAPRRGGVPSVSSSSSSSSEEAEADEEEEEEEKEEKEEEEVEESATMNVTQYEDADEGVSGVSVAVRVNATATTTAAIVEDTYISEAEQEEEQEQQLPEETIALAPSFLDTEAEQEDTEEEQEDETPAHAYPPFLTASFLSSISLPSHPPPPVCPTSPVPAGYTEDDDYTSDGEHEGLFSLSDQLDEHEDEDDYDEDDGNYDGEDNEDDGEAHESDYDGEVHESDYDEDEVHEADYDEPEHAQEYSWHAQDAELYRYSLLPDPSSPVEPEEDPPVPNETNHPEEEEEEEEKAIARGMRELARVVREELAAVPVTKRRGDVRSGRNVYVGPLSRLKRESEEEAKNGAAVGDWARGVVLEEEQEEEGVEGEAEAEVGTVREASPGPSVSDPIESIPTSSTSTSLALPDVAWAPDDEEEDGDGEGEMEEGEVEYAELEVDSVGEASPEPPVSDPIASAPTFSTPLALLVTDAVEEEEHEREEVECAELEVDLVGEASPEPSVSDPLESEPAPAPAPTSSAALQLLAPDGIPTPTPIPACTPTASQPKTLRQRMAKRRLKVQLANPDMNERQVNQEVEWHYRVKEEGRGGLQMDFDFDAF